MSDVDALWRLEPLSLPAPTVDDLAHRAALPPPGLRIPAVPATELPALTDQPIVPPHPAHPKVFLPPIEPSHGTSSVMQAGDERGASSPVGSVAVVAPIAAQLLPPAPASVAAPVSMPAPVAQLPTLPSDTVAMPSPTVPLPKIAHTLHQPSQASRTNATSWADQLSADDVGRAPRARIDRASIVQSIVLTVVMTMVGLVVGASLHVGYNRWQTPSGTPAAPAASSVDVADLSTWPQVDPPAIRFVDTVTTARSNGGIRTTSAHRDLSTGNRIVGIVDTDAAGAASDIEVEVRDEVASLRSGAAPEWTPIPLADAEAAIGPLVMADVLTVTDVFPAESLAYLTVLDSVARTLDVVPLRPSTVGPIGAQPVDLPTSGVWQYRVIIDVEAFRAAEALAYQTWERSLGNAAVPRLEAWVDGTGVVRQLAFEVDGVEVTQTLVDGSTTSTRLDVEPVAADPATPLEVAQQTEVGS